MTELLRAPRTTNVVIPPELRQRIEASAEGDKRKMKPQMLVLIEEALDARDRKANRK